MKNIFLFQFLSRYIPLGSHYVTRLLGVFIFLLSTSLCAQEVGDYRSAMTGNWSNPATWQVYNGVSWVPATSYPAQNSDVDRVSIGNGHTVTLDLDVNANMINELVIGDRAGADDILLIPNNGDFDLNVMDLVVEVDGVLDWVQNANIYLPAGARVINQGGTISTNKSCNSSQVIFIGEDKFSTCNGKGGSDYSFDELEEALPPPTSDGDIDECADNPPQTLTASATPPPNAYVVWYPTESGGSEVSPTLSSVGTVTYWGESVDDMDSSRRSIFRTAVTLTMRESPTISVSRSPSCNLLTNTYSLDVLVSGGTVTSTAGNVTALGGNEWRISEVPDGTDIVVTVTEANGCTADLPVTSPNCGCPVVDAPVSNGNVRYCDGSPIPPLSVTVNPGETADWYSAASGGSLLSSGSTSYTPAATGTYYAEARNTVTGCVSGTRTPVSLSQDTPPTVTIDPDQTVFAGVNVSFSAVVSGADVLQWQVSTDNGSTFTDLSDTGKYTGTATADLQIQQADLSLQGLQYRLVVQESGSSCAPVNSTASTLIVRLRTVITNRKVTQKVTN